MDHLIGITLELFGTILRQLGNGGLRRVPIPRSFLMEVVCCPGQSPQSIAKNRRRLARHDTAEFYASIFQTSMSSLRKRSRTEVNSTRNAPACCKLAKVRNLAVQPKWQRTRAVDILLDYRDPVIRKISRQFKL